MALATLDEAPQLQAEADLWKVAGEALGGDGVLDLGVPKPCAEFLVSGQAYTAHQRERTACAVHVRVGPREKRLMVFGDRQWIGGRPTDPQPFDAMPLDWAHAYGGADFPDNPHGRGAAPEMQDGRRVHRLPNVEPWTGRLARPDQVQEPAGLGPVSPLWPSRFKRAGQYHPSWLEEGHPGFLDTLDPHFFNAAPPDQWLVEQDELAPGTGYEIWNMHPRLACLRGHLPGWRARCFLRRHDADNLEEIGLGLTTAWFFPDQERVLLVYQGATECAEDDGADVALLMPALEAVDAPRPLSHYEAVLAQRLDAEDGALYALRDRDLVPAAALGAWDMAEGFNPMADPFARNQRARAAGMQADMRARAEAAGLDPDDFSVPLPPEPQPISLDDLPDMARQGRQMAQEARIDLMHARRQLRARVEADADALPAGMTADSLLASADQPGPGGPPSLYGQPALAALYEGRDKLAASGAGGDAMAGLMDEAASRLAEQYRHTAHLQAPAEIARSARNTRLRRRVEGLMRGSRNLSGLDLTGADLSGMDLRGARCVGTWLECADLSGADLSGADCRDAVLARVRAEGGAWRGAVLDGANLGHAQLEDVDLSEVRMAHTMLDGVVLTRCGLERAVLRECNLAGVTLTDCRFDEAELDTVNFLQASRLADTRFERARLHRAVWLDCDLDGVDYAQARLARCVWVQSRCERPLRCDGAVLRNSCSVDTDLAGASFAGAELHECSLRATNLAGADFRQALLRRCDFSECDLTGADLARARADESLFVRADLTDANLSGADLLQALMQKADLRGADLRLANLFRADLGQARLDPGTQTRGAYTRLANTRPAAAGSSPWTP